MSKRARIGRVSAPRPPGRKWLHWWRRIKESAFASGAITFHLGVWTRHRLAAGDATQIRCLVIDHGFERLLVVHGNAIEVNGRVVLLAGPSGIGKSTACERIEACGGACLLEEGLVLIGVIQGSWVVVETGTLAVLRSASRIRRGLLRPLEGAALPFRRSRPAGGPKTQPTKSILHGLAFRLAVLRHAFRRTEFQGSLRDVSGLVVAAAPDDPFPSLELEPAGSVRVVDDLLLQAPARLPRLACSLLGNAEDNVESIVRAILEVAGAGVQRRPVTGTADQSWLPIRSSDSPRALTASNSEAGVSHDQHAPAVDVASRSKREEP